MIATVLMGYGVPHNAHDARPGEGSPLSQLLWVLVYVIAFWGVLSERRASALVRASLPFVFILSLAVLSALWSDDPLSALQKASGLLGSSVLSLYLVCRLGLKRFIGTLAIALAMTAAVSAVLIAFFPDLGFMRDDSGLWKGCFVHKNHLGLAMVLGMATIACCGSGARGVRLWAQVAAFLLFLVLLIGSRSSTGLVVAVVLALLFPLLRRSRSSASYGPALQGVLVLGAGMLIAVVSGFGLEDVFGVFGKDLTFTGRTALWQLAAGAIADRPLLGYGFGEFFKPGDLNAVLASWTPGQAHNGFLQVALDLGLAGLALVIQAFLVGFKRAAALFWEHRDLASLWPILAMVYILLTNLTEAGLVNVHDVRWIIFVAAFLFASDAGLKPKGKRLPC